MFCGTRWLEDEKVASRALEIWDDVIKMCNHWESLAKSKRPSSKSYKTLLEATKDTLMQAKLHFFCFVAKAVSPFLSIYQTTKPMLPFFYDDLHDVTRLLMDKIIVSSVLNEAKSATALCKIDIAKKENLLIKPNVGFAATAEINELQKKDKVTTTSLKTFRKNCVIFLSSMLSKLLERSPLKYAVVRNASCISPQVIATKPDLSKKYLKNFLERMVQSKRISAKDADQVQTEFTKFHQSTVLQHRTLFQNFDKLNDRLDKFYFDDVSVKDFPKFERIVMMILCLGHGQAGVERGFRFDLICSKVFSQDIQCLKPCLN